MTSKNFNKTVDDDDFDEQWSPDDGFHSKNLEIQPLRAGKYEKLEFSAVLNESDAFNTCGSQKFTIFLHKPNEMPTEFHKPYFVTYNQVRVLEVHGKSIKSDKELRIHSPKARSCYFKDEKKLKFFKSYTKFHCNLECEANYTIKVEN